jgi:hypothetical protein
LTGANSNTDVAIDFDGGLEPTFSSIAVTYEQVLYIEEDHIVSSYLAFTLSDKTHAAVCCARGTRLTVAFPQHAK